MFVQQIIILSHKTYKLAHESQTRQNDYPNFVRILTAGVFKYGEITGEGAQSDEQMDNGEAQDAFGPDCVFHLSISSRIVTDRCLLMSVKRHRNVCTGVKMW